MTKKSFNDRLVSRTVIPAIYLWLSACAAVVYTGITKPDVVLTNLDGFIDEQGNSKKQEAIDYEGNARDKKKGAADAKSLAQYIAEPPFSPAEATLQVTANLFDVASLQEQYNKIRANDLYSIGTVGDLYHDTQGIVKFRPNPTNKQVLRYPHRREDDNTGTIVLYESPYKNL